MNRRGSAPHPDSRRGSHGSSSSINNAPVMPTSGTTRIHQCKRINFKL